MHSCVYVCWEIVSITLMAIGWSSVKVLPFLKKIVSHYEALRVHWVFTPLYIGENRSLRQRITEWTSRKKGKPGPKCHEVQTLNGSNSSYKSYMKSYYQDYQFWQEN